MRVGIPREIIALEKRVAATPETVKKMADAGFEISVERSAGVEAGFLDGDYERAGARLEADAASLYRVSDILLKVQKPERQEFELFKSGSLLIAMLQPLLHTDMIEALAHRKLTVLSLDMVPRIARAQKLDALSSQSNVAGYKAVLIAADRIGKMMPLLMTAAGTITPAKVLVLGAGVAGLQAIATARRLGAVVEAFDTRPVVKEQVESLGGKFLSLELKSETEDQSGYAKELSEEEKSKEHEMVQTHAQQADIIITTALIPGRPAPVLIDEETVRKMRHGSVIVDLAAEAGGNCSLTEQGKDVVKHGVSIIGWLNIPSLLANESSRLYARNIANLLFEISKKGQLVWNLEDEIVKNSLIVKNGDIVHPAIKQKLQK